MQEIQELLTYEEPKLLYFNACKPNKIKIFFNWVYFGVCSILAVLSGICVIDLVNTPFTNSIMNAVYGVVEFFAPEIELFADDSNITFVSKIFDIYSEDFFNEVLYHIADCDSMIVSEDCIKYLSKTYVRIKSPCNGMVSSIDFVDNESMIVIKLDENTAITISGKIIFGVKEGNIIYPKQLIGLNYDGDYLITLRIYKNGKLVNDILQFAEWL